MSRIGKKPIEIPGNVTINIEGKNITVKGPLGENKLALLNGVIVEKDDKFLNVAIEDINDKQQRAYHGLFRTLINNMVVGVSTGYTIQQELVGVGYRAEAKGQLLEMSLGYSHDVIMQLPKEVKVSAVTEKRANPIITLSSHDKQLIGQVAAKIRSLRKPEPYKGKGIKFVGESLRRKAGKSAGAK